MEFRWTCRPRPRPRSGRDHRRRIQQNSSFFGQRPDHALVSLLTGKVDFSNLFLALDGKVYQTLEEARTAGAATLNYGNFITTVVDFVIIAFALFLLVRQVNKLRSIAAPKPEPQQPAPPDTKTCPFCQTEIHINAIRCPNCTSDLQGS